ncbi:helix-turn-helix domain-containing protein [Novosphingobium sp. FSW06-99]|uniref:helix-turn-helix domain-containing protein n=1 Tax=Novosphingobium sp. FSW06-99 TaxID=1739113 RepID=UPI0009EB1420|nr:helix-turn-helix domain-containing protein [Novosphingobium sp. FSW06-99]
MTDTGNRISNARVPASTSDTARPMSVPQLATRWGCSDGLIYKLIKEGRLQCFRPGTLIRISVAEVERFEGQPAAVVHHDVATVSVADPYNSALRDEVEPAVRHSALPRIARKRRRRPLLERGSL